MPPSEDKGYTYIRSPGVKERGTHASVLRSASHQPGVDRMEPRVNLPTSEAMTFLKPFASKLITGPSLGYMPACAGDESRALVATSTASARVSVDRSMPTAVPQGLLSALTIAGSDSCTRYSRHDSLERTMTWQGVQLEGIN